MNACSAPAARQDKGRAHIQMPKEMLGCASEADCQQDRDAMDHAALLFTEALYAAHNAPDVRQERIEAIRAQIESGSYEIDPRRLAESLIRENPDLFDDLD